MGSAEGSQEGDKENEGHSKGDKNENMNTKGDEKGRLILNQNKPFRGEEEGENKKSCSRILQCNVETYGLHS